MHIAHRDFLFYFHLPLTRWQPASRLQGTSAQINQSRLKKKQKTKHVIVAHRNSQRFLFHWRCVCRSIFPSTGLLGFKQKARCSLHPHQPGTEQDGEIPQHMLCIAETTKNPFDFQRLKAATLSVRNRSAISHVVSHFLHMWTVKSKMQI